MKNINQVVCAACKLSDGMILAGARHFSQNMQYQARHLYGDDVGKWPKTEVQGFLDTFDSFLTREQAAMLAVEVGQLTIEQIKCWPDLHSEDLY